MPYLQLFHIQSCNYQNAKTKSVYCFVFWLLWNVCLDQDTFRKLHDCKAKPYIFLHNICLRTFHCYRRVKWNPDWASGTSNRPDKTLETFLCSNWKQCMHICSCIPTGGTLAHESYSSNSLIWVISLDQSSKQANRPTEVCREQCHCCRWNVNFLYWIWASFHNPLFFSFSLGLKLKLFIFGGILFWCC